MSSADQTASRRRREEISGDFAAWAERQRVEDDPGDVELLLDWKSNHGDGELDRWTVPDIEEFLLVGLDLAGAVLGRHADRAGRARLDGPHDLLVTTWLLARGVLDPAEVGTERVVAGWSRWPQR